MLDMLQNTPLNTRKRPSQFTHFYLPMRSQSNLSIESDSEIHLF